MIPGDNRRVKRRAVPNLEGVYSEYRAIVADMLQNSGPLIPDPNWLVADDESKSAESYDKEQAVQAVASEDHYADKVSEMNRMMAAWVGAKGAVRPTEHAVIDHFNFLRYCDPLGLWEANVTSPPSDAVTLTHTDLGTLVDLNLLYAFSPPSDSGVTTVIDVGGGYGRLAEAMFNIFGRTVKYVMVDAVPASLYYAKKYLASACPDARIGSYYDSTGRPFDITPCDIAIVPAWHFERLNTLRYDICVNIESMQEMNQQHVDYYLRLFESVAAAAATIYVTNARGYYFRGSYNYPPNWQKLFCANTPRSWLPDQPTEVFRRTDRDCSLQNLAVDAVYKYRLEIDAERARTLKAAEATRPAAPTWKRIAKPVASRLRGVWGKIG
jgi:hypothetical protein